MTNPTRIQNRRGDAAQWTAANPVLAAGEMGFESDTGKFKIGDGTSPWLTLQYYPTVSSFTDYATKSFVSSAISDLVEDAPTALATLNDLAAAIGDDANYAGTITTALGTKLSLSGGTMTGSIAMGTNKITDLGTPTLDYDAATKIYVDNLETKYSLLGHTHDLSSLTDFEITSPQNNNIMVYSNGKWINSELPSYQLADPDLTAIAALTGTSGILKKTAADTWQLDQNSYLPIQTGSQQIRSSDLTMTSAGILYPASSISLTAGTYLVMGTSTILTTSTAGNITGILSSLVATLARSSGGNSGSNTISFTTTVPTSYIGKFINGIGITLGTTITAVSGNQATLSSNFTATASGSYSIYDVPYASTQTYSSATIQNSSISLQSIITLLETTTISFYVSSSASLNVIKASPLNTNFPNATSLSAIKIG